jgi:hypothetical protein
MDMGVGMSRRLVVGQVIWIGGIKLRDHLDVPRREHKLSAHFGEAGTTIFLIQKIEYGGHNSIPRRLINRLNASHKTVSG